MQMQRREKSFLLSLKGGREKVSYAFILWKGTKEKKNRDLDMEMEVFNGRADLGFQWKVEFEKQRNLGIFPLFIEKQRSM